MIKSALTLFFVSLTLTATASATMYRCTLLDGTVVYGDKPVYESDEYCQEVKETGPQDPYQKQPQKRVYKGQKKSPTRITTETLKKSSKPQKPRASAFSQTKGKATSLVEDYKAARTRRYRESLQRDVQKAMREIKTIKEEKVTLLSGLDSNGLSLTQRDEIRNILEEIPE